MQYSTHAQERIEAFRKAKAAIDALDLTTATTQECEAARRAYDDAAWRVAETVLIDLDKAAVTG